ncbi:MAG: glycosyltransferase family 4 protein [Verrucomicrobiota bacterium]
MPAPLITFVRRRWNEAGGAEHYLSRLVTRLREMDYQCNLLCESWEQPDSPFNQIRQIKVSGFRHTAPENFANGVNRIPRRELGVVFSLERGITAPIYRAGDGVHRQWLHRRAQDRFWRKLRNGMSLKNHVLHAMEKQTFHPLVTGTVIANSEMVKQEILAATPFPEERIAVIPNGVDADYFGSGSRAAGRAALGWGDHEFICLLVGRGALRKGHEQARQVVERAGQDYRLAIIDSPPSCVMPDVYAAADVFVLPTVYDPFANVTLEAMAAGLPVVTTKANGARQVIEDGKNGLLVEDANSIDEMVNYLRDLKETGWGAAIGARARQTAQSCTWEKHLRATLEIIRQVNQ